MSVTIIDIANECGVAPSTVSRIINGKKGFLASQETRRSVLEAAERLGYKPNRSARALVTGRTNTIGFSGGLCVGDQLHGHVTKVVRERLARNDLDLIVGYAERQGDMSLDGMIIWNDMFWVKDNCISGEFRNKPVVVFGSDYATSDLGIDCVGISIEIATHQAMDHLIDQGCRRIVHCHHSSCDSWVSWGEARHRIYTKKMLANGLTPECLSIAESNRRMARTAVKEYIRDNGCPDAIFAVNDEIAIGINAGLRDLGVRVPEDIAIVGCDGIEDCEYCSPTITSIEQPFEVACGLIADFLTNRIHNPSYPLQRVVLQSELVIRESSIKGGE